MDQSFSQRSSRAANKLVSINENRTLIQSEQGRFPASTVLPLLDNYGSSEDEDEPSSDSPVLESGGSKDPDDAVQSSEVISKSESVLSKNLTADEELLSSADIRRFLLRYCDQTENYNIPEQPIDKSPDPLLEAKIESWARLRQDGVRFNDRLRHTHAFNNPCIMSKMISFIKVDEHGSEANPGLLFQDRMVEALTTLDYRALRQRQEDYYNHPPAAKKSRQFVPASGAD